MTGLRADGWLRLGAGPAIVSCTFLLAAGCSVKGSGLHSSPELREIRSKIEKSDLALAKLPSQDVAAYYANRTVKTYGPGHGTQVEYFSRGGKCYLWYPGNRRISSCRWKIEQRATKSPWSDGNDVALPHICFSYGPNSSNPVTGHTGSGWQCKRALMTSTDKDGKVSFKLPPPGFPPATADSVSGDPFGLENREGVPFVLEKRRYEFAELRASLQ
jgi:hypothetical protein